MPSPEIKDALTSVDPERVDELWTEHVAATVDADATTFAADLYRRGAITRAEYTRTQLLASVEVTAPTVLRMDRHRRKRPRGGADLPDTEIDWSSPKHADRPERPASVSLGYTLLDAIDEGGMGEILVARDNDLGRTVAFKKIHAHVAEYAGMVERFFMEAQVTAQLQHPYIVPVYQLVEQEGEIGYAMKLIAGKTLAQLVEERRAAIADGHEPDDEHSLATLLDHFLKVCDAIHYANRKGVLHRDLKPANVMVGAYNEVYVMDWGIARLMDHRDPGFEDVIEGLDDVRQRREEDRTQVGDAIGTPAYMSPEQARGDLARLDHRSDQYALGLILFELLSCRRALEGRNPTQLRNHAKEGVLRPLTPPEGSREPIPKPLAAIVGKATRVEPDDRYASVKELADDVRRYLHDEAVLAMPDTLSQRLGRWIARHRVAAINIVAWTLVACLALAALLVIRFLQAELAAEEREVHIGHMSTLVSGRASDVDAHMLRIEGILDGIAANAAALLAHGRPEIEPLYSSEDYADPGRAPPDLAPSPVRGRPVSVEWPVYKLAPGVDTAEVATTLRKVDPLRHGMRHLMLRGAGGVTPADRSRDAGTLIRDQGLPIAFIQAGFEHGFVMGYPGHAGYPEDFDPRRQPWYTRPLARGAAEWLAPFHDASSGGMVLSCATAIVTDGGDKAGAVVVEMPLARVREEFLSLRDMPGIVRLLLLDTAGEVMAVSGAAGEHGSGGDAAAAGAGVPDAYRDLLLGDIAARRSGFATWQEGDREMLLAYDRLASNGWYLVAEADAAAVLAHHEKADPDD